MPVLRLCIAAVFPGFTLRIFVGFGLLRYATQIPVSVYSVFAVLFNGDEVDANSN